MADDRRNSNDDKIKFESREWTKGMRIEREKIK